MSVRKLFLIGCEESQSLTKAFRKNGIEAYSCDVLDCSGGHPEWHIKDDILYIINQAQWHTFIGFPPCTYLCNAQLHINTSERLKLRKEASDFFKKLYNSDIPRIGIENPIGLMNTDFKAPSQIISPNDFGDDYYKDICLWLKNLPLIHSSNFKQPSKKIENHVNGRMTKIERSRIKSSWKMFPNMCKSIAEQWSKDYVNISELV